MEIVKKVAFSESGSVKFYLRKEAAKKTCEDTDITVFCDSYFNLLANVKQQAHYGSNFKCLFCYEIPQVSYVGELYINRGKSQSV